MDWYYNYIEHFDISLKLISIMWFKLVVVDIVFEKKYINGPLVAFYKEYLEFGFYNLRPTTFFYFFLRCQNIHFFFKKSNLKK